jgi:hypothetical protein
MVKVIMNKLAMQNEGLGWPHPHQCFEVPSRSGFAPPRVPGVKRKQAAMFLSSLRQFPQRFAQIGQALNFRHDAL